jgi:hypothetical protein
MVLTKTTANGTVIAIASSDAVLIYDAQSALDFIVSVRYETGSHSIIISKASVIESFFVLSSGIAGEILQKFINYGVRLAIVGDFSVYTSKPFKDFIYESNKGSHIFFVSSEKEAMEKLSRI